MAITTEVSKVTRRIPTHSVASWDPHAEVLVAAPADGLGSAEPASYPSFSSSGITTLQTKLWPVVKVADGRSSAGETCRSKYGCSGLTAATADRVKTSTLRVGSDDNSAFLDLDGTLPLVLEEEERLRLRDLAAGAALFDAFAVALAALRVVVDDDFTGEGVTGAACASWLFDDHRERLGGEFADSV